MKVLPILALTTVLGAPAALAAECSDVEYHQDVLDKYPAIANACQEVTEKNGKSYVKVTADFISFRRPDKLTVNVHENDGSKERQTIKVDPQMRVTVGESKKRFSDLPRNYTLNFSIPSDRFEMASHEEMNEAPVEEVAVVEELPKTASVWPTLGLAGFTMVLFSQLLTWRRKKA
jgi:hypothetical protein